jgi:hypothetical protein
LHFPTVTDQTYHRPLFYVGQGWIWRLVGYHDAYGRAFAFSFSMLLAWSVWTLAAAFCDDASRLAQYMAATLLLAISGVAAGMSSGLTDVPVAAMTGCAAAVLWTRPAGTFRAVLLIAFSCFAVLVKPSALTSLFGLGCAHLLGPTSTFRQRVRTGCVPIAGGTALALAYDMTEARRLGMSLHTFLIGGLAGYYEKLNAQAFVEVLRDWGWLGPALRLPLVVALIYGLLRLADVSHRRALKGGAAAAVVITAVGFWTAVRYPAPNAAVGRVLYDGFMLLCSVVLAAACLLSDDEGPGASRLNLARLVVWMVPGLWSWLWYAAYDIRLLAPVWTPIVVLMCCALAPAASAGLSRARWTGIAITAVVLVFSASNIVRLDGLEWKPIGAAVAAGKWRPGDLRHAMMPELMNVVEQLQVTTTSENTILSPEGRLRFFFPGRVFQGYPHRCRDLEPYAYFVLPTGRWMELFFATEIGVPGTVEFWASCRAPRLTLAVQTSAYAVYRVAQTLAMQARPHAAQADNRMMEYAH